MQELNLPDYTFRFKSSENKRHIFDGFRKKFVVLTPEEWVRQHILQFLHNQYNYPKSLIAVEKQIKINGLIKRFDIVVFNTKGNVFLVVECKAPEIDINQSTFDQIARYNIALNASFLMVTNGLKHYFCQIDSVNEKYIFLPDIPKFSEF
ncbi:MAG: type I restriction enzyme HsdR N-terminal domain-containing protein [Flavobacteriaceae bacterium]|jgi:type I site-specific restriction endonuclease|nr:type I restriction enzyme HsdR N-terminal domain-containing protein [Flavobacteriaceae bacterium]